MSLENILDYYEGVLEVHDRLHVPKGTQLAMIGELLSIITHAEELTPQVGEELPDGLCLVNYDLLCDLNEFWQEIA